MTLVSVVFFQISEGSFRLDAPADHDLMSFIRRHILPDFRLHSLQFMADLNYTPAFGLCASAAKRALLAMAASMVNVIKLAEKTAALTDE